MANEQYDTQSLLAIQKIPTDDPDGVMALESVVNSALEMAEHRRQIFAIQAFTNTAYLLGNHLVQFFFTPSSGFGIHRFGSHDESRYDSLLAKSADNRLIRAVESVVAMLTGQMPEPRVQPNSELPEDEDAAALSEVVLKVVYERPLNMHQLLRDAASLACQTHLVAAEVEYGETDIPVQIEKFKTVKRENPLYEKGDPEDEKEIESDEPDGFETTYKRDIQCHLWTNFNLIVDPAATSEEDMIWVARQSIEDVDWIVENYARDLPGYLFKDAEELKANVPAQSLTGAALYWWHRIKDVIETPQYYGFGMAVRDMVPNQAMLTVIDVKFCKDYPQGRTLVFAGEKLVYAGPSRSWSAQYPWRWHPYSFFGWFRVPGRFYRVPLLSQILPLQKKINAIDALVQANRQYMAFGQYWIPASCRVQEGRLSGIPGEHYTYIDNGTGTKPERVQNQPLPQELLIERDQLVQSIEHLSGIYVTPQGQISASANRAEDMLAFLRQERLQSKKPMLQDFEHFLENVSQNILIEIQLNLLQEDPELTQRIQIAAREHSSLTVQSFVGQSLRDHHAVKIDITSGLMQTKEAQAAKAMEFFQFSGGNVSPPERRAILEATGLMDYVKNPENASVERARRIVSRIRTGQLEQVFQLPGESASAMLPVFVDEILSDRFHDLQPQQKQLLLNYQQLYQQIVQAEQQQMLQMQLLLAGAKGGSPGGEGQPQA